MPTTDYLYLTSECIIFLSKEPDESKLLFQDNELTLYVWPLSNLIGD